MRAAVGCEDGSVIIAGFTVGNWAKSNTKGSMDFAAVKLDPAAAVVWTWQVQYVDSISVLSLLQECIA